VVKRISSSRLFVQLLRSKSGLCEPLINVPLENFEEEYITDAALMRDLLSEGEYTSFIRYRVTGKTRGRNINVPRNAIPAASYVMTDNREIFRVEFPAYYLSKSDDHQEAHELMQTFLALARENNGGLPSPNVFADDLASYSQNERKSAEAILDSWATDELENLQLNRVYGEI